MAFVEFKNVKKVYHMGEVDIHALQDVNFEIQEGGILRYCRSFRGRENHDIKYSGRDGYSFRGAGHTGWEGNFCL